MEHGGLNDGQVDHADGGEGEQKENGGKHGQDSQALHLPVLLGAGVWVFIFNYLQAAVPDGRDTARIWMQPQAEMGLPSPSGEYSGPPPGTAEAIITVISSDCNPIVENLRLFWYNWMTIYGA